MPDALLTNCAEPGCPELVASGRCPAHARPYDRYRGSSTSRGYGSTWRAFRERFKTLLIAAGVAPVCGAALPDGPDMSASRCRALGILTWQRLHLHHHPPLRDDERADRRAVEDPRRVGFLCEPCHNAETAREQQR